jgi:hypothetical protein
VRKLLFFATILGVLALANTGFPKVGFGWVVNEAQAKAWADSLRGNSKDFLLILVLTAYIDLVRSRIKSDEVIQIGEGLVSLVDIHHSMIDERLSNYRDEIAAIVDSAIKVESGHALDTIAPNQLLATALGRKLQAHPESYPLLISAVLGHDQGPIFTEMSVDMALSPHPQSTDHYIIRQSVRSETPFDEYVLALALQLTDGEHVLMNCPSVVTCWIALDKYSFEHTTKLILEEGKADLLLRNLGGDISRVSSRLTVVDPAEYPIYVGREYESLHDSVRLFRAVDLKKSSGSTTLATHTTAVLPRSPGFFAFTVDAPTFVKSILFDVGSFQKEATNFRLIPFMGATTSIQVSPTAQGKLWADVNNWLIRGQGVCLVWEPKLGRKVPQSVKKP